LITGLFPCSAPSEQAVINLVEIALSNRERVGLAVEQGGEAEIIGVVLAAGVLNQVAHEGNGGDPLHWILEKLLLPIAHEDVLNAGGTRKLQPGLTFRGHVALR